jgi:redox-sensitive bicupin YhaK (pirin superfamily)
MSYLPAAEPRCTEEKREGPVDLVIEARTRDLGEGFAVRRILPAARRRMVGPFIFFDHMGPVDFAPGHGLDVRPHPHIALATVTYLFEGEIVHRDSLGSHETIRPGEVNWMTAGRGIVHSERTGPELRARGARLHGIQLWVALPAEHEEHAPEFHHHDAASLPELELAGARVRVLAGSAYGATSPVRTFSPLAYVDATVPAGGELPLPDAEERALYVADGRVSCGSERAGSGTMLVLAAAARAFRAETPARVMLIGGAPVGPRHIFWNFVSSSPERIEQAKADWRAGRFPKVPGDEIEFIPLPG